VFAASRPSGRTCQAFIISPLAGSGSFFGSFAPTSCSSVGVGAELAHPFFPSPLPIDLGEKIRSSPHVVEFQALLVLLSEG